MLDNPCVTLSNDDSHTNWVGDYSNSRCERTVAEQYSALNETVWKNAYGQRGSWNGTSVGVDANGGWCRCTNCNPSGTWRQGAQTSWAGYLLTCSFYRWTCTQGGTLSGSTCTRIDTEYKNFSEF